MHSSVSDKPNVVLSRTTAYLIKEATFSICISMAFTTFLSWKLNWRWEAFLLTIPACGLSCILGLRDHLLSFRIYDDHFEVRRGPRKICILQWKHIETVRANFIYGRYAHAYLRFSLNHKHGKISIHHRFSKDDLEEIFTEFDRRGIEVFIH